MGGASTPLACPMNPLTLLSFQVADIPKDMRLGCTVKVPKTSYKEVVMPEDDFRVDNLSESFGSSLFDPGNPVSVDDAC